MIVVSDTSPLCYLVLIGYPDVFQRLYGEILTTETVMTELRHSEAPELVRVWAVDPPPWLKVFPDPPEFDRTLVSLHAGERTALRLAEQMDANIILLDETAARAVAAQRGLKVSGLLGVLRKAAQEGLVNLPLVVDRLRQTTFRASPLLYKSLLPKPRN